MNSAPPILRKQNTVLPTAERKESKTSDNSMSQEVVMNKHASHLYEVKDSKF